MKWWAVRWILVGLGAAIVVGAVGSVIMAVRRGIMLADEEATIALPIEERVDAAR
jgi:hypothetical protein